MAKAPVSDAFFCNYCCPLKQTNRKKKYFCTQIIFGQNIPKPANVSQLCCRRTNKSWAHAVQTYFDASVLMAKAPVLTVSDAFFWYKNFGLAVCVRSSKRYDVVLPNLFSKVNQRWVKAVSSKKKVQVNLFQKHLFLHQLTHNMTKDCSGNCKFITYMKIPSSEHFKNMLCTWNCSECQSKNKKQFVYTECSWNVLSLEFSCTELVIQWTICRHTVTKMRASDKYLPVQVWINFGPIWTSLNHFGQV